jgi:delta 1-pyrroline-5-carboxylate dehydrogenase
MDWDLIRSQAQNHQSHIIVFLATVIGIVLFRSLSATAIPQIQVPLLAQARQGWTGKVLRKPSIQTSDPSVIQCYCPATGQLLDTLRAATTEDVDTAIEKATAAQLKWRTTTFKQRAHVLKTLLKFILDNQGEPFELRWLMIREYCSRFLPRFRGKPTPEAY